MSDNSNFEVNAERIYDNLERKSSNMSTRYQKSPHSSGD